jgi:hypothetical protein
MDSCFGKQKCNIAAIGEGEEILPVFSAILQR